MLVPPNEIGHGVRRAPYFTAYVYLTTCWPRWLQPVRVLLVCGRLKPCPFKSDLQIQRSNLRLRTPAGAAAGHASVAAAVSGHDAAAEAAGGGVAQVDDAGEGVGSVDAAGSGFARAGFGTADQGQRGLGADAVGLGGWSVRRAVGDAWAEAFE